MIDFREIFTLLQIKIFAGAFSENLYFTFYGICFAYRVETA